MPQFHAPDAPPSPDPAGSSTGLNGTLTIQASDVMLRTFDGSNNTVSEQSLRALIESVRNKADADAVYSREVRFGSWLLREV